MTVIPEGYAQVTIHHAGVGLPEGGDVVFGVINALDLSPAAIGAAVKTVWDTNVMNVMSQAVRMNGILVKLGPNDTGASAEVPASTVGAGAAACAPPNVTCLWRKVTPLGGRRGRGRMYLPGVIESQVDAGGFGDSTYIADWTTSAEDTLLGLSTADIPMVVLHGYATVWALIDGQPRRIELPGVIPAPTAVTSLEVSPKVATQRRRLR